MTFEIIFSFYFCLWVVFESITCYYIFTDISTTEEDCYEDCIYPN